MMKLWCVFLSLLILTTVRAQADDTGFYQCTLPQAEEFRVGIDLDKAVAAFFDNDSTSVMHYQGFRESRSNPGHDVLMYQGKDQGGDGDLLLEFNKATKRIKLSTLETDGTIELLGYSECHPDSAWEIE